MPLVNEQRIKEDLKHRRLSRVYFLYGEESFLVKTYADKIKNTALSPNDIDMNLKEFSGNPNLDELYDYVEALPFFAEHKVVMINDFNLEKLSDEDGERLISIISDVSEAVIIIFYLTGCGVSLRSQKLKKLFEEIKKYAQVCEFKTLTIKETAQIIFKKIEREGRRISALNANYLAEITLCDLNLASVETTKLCSYVSKGGEITREIIDKMVEKRLETKVFALSDAMIEKNRSAAFRILNELFNQRAEPIPVLAVLFGAYSELYAAKTADASGVSSAKAAADLGYTGARAGFFSKKYAMAKKLSINSLRKAMSIIYESDIKLKTAAINANVLLERTVLKLMTL